ncbi:hypothetical protein [Mycobacterium sp. CnD-18-1]|uniref:hypothetical protein n=1 Tax=Mycobacterium sp. CnD-18-1 TaxID=2917744 RepID=UPI001EF25908|nr:hypothetical protein [Mycobacterium sp. CnD-18-1]MCG7607188.1 hypothetical protein [Mycobacterium sp. CnD-18-1]
MPRTDASTGLDLIKLLIHTVSAGDLKVGEIRAALGLGNSSYYNRIEAGDFPNAEEIDAVVEKLHLRQRYGLTTGELKVRFGIIGPEDVPRLKRELSEIEEYLGANLLTGRRQSRG